VRLDDRLQNRVIDFATPTACRDLARDHPAVASGADGVEHIRGTSPDIRQKCRAQSGYRDVVDLLTASKMTIRRRSLTAGISAHAGARSVAH
jgi:hypothetical protein